VATSQYCTFHLGSLLLGIDVQQVQEVVRPTDTTRVPLAPPVIRGLINLRGHLVTAIDLRRQLGLTDPPPADPPMNLIVRTAGEPVSLLVDAIGDVLEVDSGVFEPPPETLRGPARDLVRGAYKLPGRLLLTLDHDRAVAVATDPPPA
jgi:purine-binding chemotaxis protein CheW